MLWPRKEIVPTVTLMILILLLITTPIFAQNKKLTYQQVFENGEPQMLGMLPQIKGWLDDENYLEYYNDPENGISTLNKIHAASGKSSVFLDYNRLNEQYLNGFDLRFHVARTKDYTGFVLRKGQDLYYFSTNNNVLKRLTHSLEEEKNPTFSPNGRFVAFTRRFNLFVVDVMVDREYQLTQDSSETIYNGWASWVYYEEILRRRSQYKAFWWSPNSEKIAFMRFDDGEVPRFPLVRTNNKHNVLTFQHYPKAGDVIPKVKLGIIDIMTNKKIWVDIDEDIEQYVAWPFWTWDNKYILFQWINRDQNVIKIYKANSEQGSRIELYENKQSTWVDYFEDNGFFVLKDGSGFLIRSNEDGWYHLYHYDLNGSLENRLTRGEWNVKEIVSMDEDKEVVYFHGAVENSTENHLYRVDFNGDNLKKLTRSSGTHEATLSPNNSYFYDNYSSISYPERIDLSTTDGKFIRKIGDRKLASLESYVLGQTQLFTIPINDSYNLPATWILPVDFNKSNKYPVILSVYGGPDRIRVKNSYRDFSDQYLAQNGIITLRVDHRGSGHFGKKGMDYMHRNLGKWEMHDLISVVKWLGTLSFIDSTRVGITGTSYGGYLTCMALTYGADYFTHGVAWYPVTDWRWYDAVYTERYMDKPDENYNGYLFGSPITHADKYKGTLLITHGTLDDNVHFQHSAHFIKRLQELNKHFELMVYINSRHGYVYPKSRHAKREEINFWFRHFLGKNLDLE